MRVAVWAILAAGLAAAPDRIAAWDGDPGDVEGAVAAALERHACASAGVALVGPAGAEWTAGVGLLEPGGERRAEADTLFRQGSISKTVVGLAVLLLVERGRLDLDDRLADLAPDLAFGNPWEASDPVRLAHLLEHTSGFDDLRLKDYAHNDPRGLPLGEGLAFCRGSLVARWPPGRFFSYSNAGAAVAAYVVERFAGKSFERFAEDEIFRPLGMATATFWPPREGVSMAAGLDRRRRPTRYAHILTRPSGALNASPRDMAALVRFLLARGKADGRELLRRESVERMETARTSLAAGAGLGDGYGLGNASLAAGRFPFRGHSGAIAGFASEYGYWPEAGVGYAAMVACEGPEALGDVSGILRERVTAGLAAPAPPVEEAPAVAAGAWLGYYRPFTPRGESYRFLERLAGVARLAATAGGGLLVDPAFGSPVRYEPAGGATFRRTDEPWRRIALVRDDDGTPLVVGSANLRRASALAVWMELAAGSVSFAAMAAALLLAALSFVRPERVEAAADLRVAAAPALCLLATILVWVAGMTDAVDRLGRPSPWSWGFVAASWAFVACAAGSLARLAPRGFRGCSRNRRLALAASAGAALVAAYLLAWGVVGWRMWR